MAQRKVVFVLVEGPSDKTALELAFTSIFNKEYVYVGVMYCDITTKGNTNSANIIKKIQKEVADYATKNKLKKSDFLEIIHIIDTDGAFISDDNIIEVTKMEKTFYSPLNIQTRYPQRIIQRNKQKRESINKLCTTNQIWTIPYKVFYMSANLDHVLYNKLNSSDQEKEKDSFDFAKKYEDNIFEFIKFITLSDFSVMLGYKESWEYIKKDLHSLERHTNLGLCFPEKIS